MGERDGVGSRDYKAEVSYRAYAKKVTKAHTGLEDYQRAHGAYGVVASGPERHPCTYPASMRAVAGTALRPPQDEV